MSRKSVQRFCDNDMQKNNNLKRVARSYATRFRSDRAAVPGDLSDWNRQSGRFDLKVRRSGGGLRTAVAGFGLTARDVLVAKIGPAAKIGPVAKIGSVVESCRRHFGGALG